MNNKVRLLFAVLGLAVLLSGVFAFFTRPVPRPIVIQVTGPPGAKVAVTCEADGEPRDFPEKVAPAEYSVSAHRLSFEVRRTGGNEGDPEVTLLIGGEAQAKATSPAGVRGGFEGPSYFNTGAGRVWISGVGAGQE